MLFKGVKMTDRQVSRERIALRVPDELKRRLHASALKTGRTMNSEIISRLLESYGEELKSPVPEVIRPQSLESRVDELERAVALLSSKVGTDVA